MAPAENFENYLPELRPVVVGVVVGVVGVVVVVEPSTNRKAGFAGKNVDVF